MNGAKEIIEQEAKLGLELRNKFFQLNSDKICEAALKTSLSLAKGGKLLICGNGGSAADAQHVAGEFINRFLFDRPALPAISLVADTSVLTSIANDASFETIFSRQIEALAWPGDVLLAISVSGNSPNILKAMEAGQQKNMYIIALTGSGGKMEEFADLLISVPSRHTPQIQELHLVFEHLFCQLTDYFMFQNPETLAKILQETK